jgi:EAL domain-containing protein (putative c-di-GMP-specific phosphodiesterase class I)
MLGLVARITAAPGRWLKGLRQPAGADPRLMERFRWGFWVLNLILFACLTVPTLLVEGAGWPLRLAATAGLVGAVVWEAAALHARRFPLWADVLETAAVFLVAWRYPFGQGLIVIVLVFVLPALGFRILYGSPRQAAVRTATVLAALFAGRILSQVGLDPWGVLDWLLAELLAAVLVAILFGLLARLLHQHATVAREPAMRTSIRDRLELESDLSRAVDRGELVLHYQPIVLLGPRCIAGVEALVRWNHPRWGMIPPARFIPVAEASGLIIQIGAWVLRNGCRQLRDWSTLDPDLAGLTLSVNLSATGLARADLPCIISRIFDEEGIDPRRIVLEVTESALVDNTSANVGKLEALKALGLRLAVDDFGTGFSSLSYLRRFPFEQLKIDRSFVHGIEVDQDAAALARSIIGMGTALGLSCVAEGVETLGEADWLTAAGCDLAQGYFFAPAMPSDQLAPMLTSGRPLPPCRQP